MTWELRWHPFRGQWVLFTSHRDARPWIGEIVAPQESPIPLDNALAPRGKRIATTNPDYRGVFVFTNDLPVFSPDAPERDGADDVYRTRRAGGTAEVVCYHDDATRSLADLGDDEVCAIVLTWRERSRALQARDDVAHVLIFENRGAVVGTSNPHPHCQIYAGWGDTGDPMTAVDAEVIYSVRASPLFGFEEHARSQVALDALRQGEPARLGPLLRASHAGYEAMGLGHPAATATVEAALAAPGVYGARASGGGCGGTIVVICERGALDHVDLLIR